MGITKLSIAAIKHADRIIFRHLKGESRIEAVKEASERNPFEQSHWVDCAAEFIDYSENKVFGPALDTFTAFEMHSYPTRDIEWTSIVSLLREGDELTLVWTRDAYKCQNLDAAQLHGDCLSLRIQRGDRRMQFAVEWSVCPDNTARMIRRDYGKQYTIAA